MYYTAKAIWRFTLSEAKSSVPFPSTGSFINEQSVTMPNLLYNLINFVLTEDQSDRPISDLEVEMSEPTNIRVVSFAQDLIYDVTFVDLAVLLKHLTGSAELVKARQTLCRVGDRSNILNGIFLDVKLSYVLSTLFRQLVIFIRYDSFCFDYQKTPSALATIYKRRHAETHKEHISRQQFGNVPVSQYIS